jgi:hypothetical protein
MTRDAAWGAARLFLGAAEAARRAGAPAANADALEVYARAVLATRGRVARDEPVLAADLLAIAEGVMQRYATSDATGDHVTIQPDLTCR